MATIRLPYKLWLVLGIAGDCNPKTLNSSLFVCGVLYPVDAVVSQSVLDAAIVRIVHLEESAASVNHIVNGIVQILRRDCHCRIGWSLTGFEQSHIHLLHIGHSDRLEIRVAIFKLEIDRNRIADTNRHSLLGSRCPGGHCGNASQSFRVKQLVHAFDDFRIGYAAVLLNDKLYHHTALNVIVAGLLRIFDIA